VNLEGPLPLRPAGSVVGFKRKPELTLDLVPQRRRASCDRKKSRQQCVWLLVLIAGPGRKLPAVWHEVGDVAGLDSCS